MDPLDPATLLRAALALLAVVGLALLLARLAKRGGLGGATALSGPNRRLVVEQALALDPRRRLVLVRCDGREGLILTGPAGDAWLGWLDAPRAGKP